VVKAQNKTGERFRMGMVFPVYPADIYEQAAQSLIDDDLFDASDFPEIGAENFVGPNKAN
jgi:hypothetical protein